MTTAREVLVREIANYADWDNAATEAADACLQALFAAGYAIVPREPTPEMVYAATGRSNATADESMYASIWRAMVAAAEEAP